MGILLYGEIAPTVANSGNVFGNHTFGAKWKNGYIPLAVFDQDLSGDLTGVELQKIWVWVDANSDALIQPGEVLPAAFYVKSLSTRYESDKDGDAWQMEGARLINGRSARTWDWWSRLKNPFALRRNGKTSEPAVIQDGDGPGGKVSIYYWYAGAQHGLLRFIRHPDGRLYILSMMPPVPTGDQLNAGDVVVAPVIKKGDDYSWVFDRPFRGIKDVNTASDWGDMLDGKARFTKRGVLEEIPWTAILVTDPSSFPDSLREKYRLLCSFSPLRFAQALEKRIELPDGLKVLGGKELPAVIQTVSIGEILKK